MALRLLRHELEVLKLESEMQDKTRSKLTGVSGTITSGSR